MNIRTQSSSRRHRGRSIPTAGLLVALTLLTFAAIRTSAAAQSRITTTIIPSRVEAEKGGTEDFETSGKVLLHFQTPTLPPGAEVVKATLQLSCKDMMRGSDGNVSVSFIGSDKAEVKFGSRNFNRNIPGEKNPIQWTTTQPPPGLKDLKIGTSFALQLVPDTKPNPARRWYSIDDKDAESKFRPRLILEYTVPKRLAVSQTEGVPATHSLKDFLPTPAAGAQFSSRDVSVIWSYAPVFYHGLVYLITQDGTRYQLQALPALGGQPVWSEPLAEPGQHLLLSEAGRLYIVGNKKILVYKLDLENAVIPATEVKTSSGQTLSPTLAPAVGADGSLYFVNGQEVYSLNPDLQELWKVKLDNKTTSRVTVGPSGHFVYLLGQKDGQMSLIAIDARTGESFSAKLPNSDLLKSFDNPALQAPVVLLHPDGTEKIYVAANSAKDGSLACFDNPRTRETRKTGSLNQAEHWRPLTGLFSQPIAGLPSVAGDWNIYSVKVTEGQGQLLAINWLKGSPEPIGNAFLVGASPDILNGGNMAADSRGNILVWNGKEAKLYAFGPDASGLSPAVLTGLTDNSRLLFGSDGTLYAPDPNNIASRRLRAIAPQYTVGGSSGAIISSPTHLFVDGAVNKATTLSAPGSVFLGNGFTVKQGATLTIKQPKS